MSGNDFIAMVGMILILLFVIMQLGPLISIWFYCLPVSSMVSRPRDTGIEAT